MRRIKQFFRLAHIYFALFRHGLDEIVLNIPWFYPFRFFAYLNPWNWFHNRGKSDGVRIRLLLEELGPIFVKFGQLLSTRRDLLPDDIIEELEKLQDKVPPFSSKQVRAVIENSYRKDLSQVFPVFEITPFASASIAQVHAAILPDGQEVVVKVRRPDIKKVIRQDLDLLYDFARLVEHYWSEGPRFKPVEIVAEFERVLMEELDFLREAASASQLRRNFLDSDLLYVPQIHWHFCTESVMVMERIEGIPISDIETLRDLNVDFKLLAERGVEIFFTQVFRDCFFHADMHPGNIFVAANKPRDPQYIAVDFGIMGSLSPSDQRYLAENFLAFFRHDYFRVAELHVESGWVPPNIRIDEFESAIRTVCEPVFQRPLKEISFGRLLMKLFQTAKRFHMEVQPQLLLLQKTLLHVEGLGRQLYPELDLWTTAKPFLEDWLKQQVGPRALFRKIKQNIPYWFEKMPEIPDLMYRFLRDYDQQAQQRLRMVQHVKPVVPPKSPGIALGISITCFTLLGLEYLFFRSGSVLFYAPDSFLWGLSGIGFLSLFYAILKR